MVIETSLVILLLTIIISISYWCGCNDTKLKYAPHMSERKRVGDLQQGKVLVATVIMAVIIFMFWAVWV